MCGIIAILLANREHRVNELVYDGLTVLQHRGQDAAGIVTSDGNRVHMRKDNGLVRSVFQSKHMRDLKGHIGVGHCRYPTAGSSSAAESQPFFTNSPYGLVLGHNGNLVNCDTLRKGIKSSHRHLNTNSDSEILLNVLAEEIISSEKRAGGERKEIQETVFEAVEQLFSRCIGGYAVTAMIVGAGIIGFRDPHGIRPLVLGRQRSVEEEGSDSDPEHVKYSYMLASESVAIDVLGFEVVRDILPGECVFISNDGSFYEKQCCPTAKLNPCIFEYVYLARPDSTIDGISVYRSRQIMGLHLAEKIRRLHADDRIDIVVPVPDTSRTSAQTCAEVLNIPYREGFIKNRYIARTFIMPGQQKRKKSVRQKLNPLTYELKGKNVLLVDDSIVRGTTSLQLVQMARAAGAKKVFFASAAPAIRFPNVYGIDMPTTKELIAHGRSDEDVASAIEADWVVYLDLDALKASVNECAAESGVAKIDVFDCSCFDGCYITGGVSEEYLHGIHMERNDVSMRSKKKLMPEDNEAEELDIPDVYNSS